MKEEWSENVASVFGSLRIGCCMVRVVCCTFCPPTKKGFGFWPACVLQPNRFLPARLLLFFVHLFYGKAVLPTDNYIAVPAVLYRKWLYVIITLL